MRFGIPGYRLPKNVLDSEIRDIENMGIEIKTDTPIESIYKFFKQGYDAVLVAVGTPKGQKLSIPGADHEGVLISTDFLKDVNLGEKVKIGKKVVVLGGGNVAFDCARVARRLGAEQVHIACLECRTDMPAACDEIDQGEEEGISIYPSKTSNRILVKNGKAAGVETLEVESVCFDEENNPEIKTVPDSYQKIEADTVIFAIGQTPDIPSGFNLDL